MHIEVFSKVYCDRVYFLCTERFVTGSGFEPPAAPPTHLRGECPPPPPPRVDAIKSSISGPCNKVEVTCAATAGVEFMSDPYRCLAQRVVCALESPISILGKLCCYRVVSMRSSAEEENTK